MTRPVGEIVVDYVLRYFGRGLPQQVSPWWWPMNDGAELGDWGLDPEGLARHRVAGDSVLSSLRGPSPRRDDRLAGFLGAVGSTRRTCDVVLLSTRPSQDGFPGTSPRKLVHRLAGSGLMPRTHTTNLIKFRGHEREGDDLMAIRGVEPRVATRMLRASVDCFAAEIRALQPRCLLVAGGGTRATLERMCHSSFPGSHEVKAILDAIPQAHVRSWVAAVDAAELAEEWATEAGHFLD